MKLYMLFFCLTTALAMPLESMARGHGNAVPDTAMQVANAAQQDELEAFSDTTTTVSDSAVQVSYNRQIDLDEDGLDQVVSVLFSDSSMREGLTVGLVMMVVLLAVFVLAPLAVLALLLYLVYKNRRQKAGHAGEGGRSLQPVPDQLFDEQQAPVSANGDLRAKGIRQTALGVGLMVFLGSTIGNIGFGVGALVTAIGVGNLLVAWSHGKKEG